MVRCISRKGEWVDMARIPPGERGRMALDSRSLRFQNESVVMSSNGTTVVMPGRARHDDV
jgi:hypothetical protein